MACDICLKIGDCRSLNHILDWSITKNMVICDDCAKISNKMLDKYRDMAWIRVKKKLKRIYKEARLK